MSTFTQYYGSKEIDASVLRVAMTGFLPPDDERITGTIEAIERHLTRDGLVSRHSTAETDDGLPGDEGQFLACSFCLVSALALSGRVDRARLLQNRQADEQEQGQEHQLTTLSTEPPNAPVMPRRAEAACERALAASRATSSALLVTSVFSSSCLNAGSSSRSSM
jgi:hypothetical protein